MKNRLRVCCSIGEWEAVNRNRIRAGNIKRRWKGSAGLFRFHKNQRMRACIRSASSGDDGVSRSAGVGSAFFCKRLACISMHACNHTHSSHMLLHRI